MSHEPPISAEPLKVLFLCTGNACRSQMAEGFTRQFHAKTIAAYSAGTDPQGVHPHAITVMAERGIDISDQRSKSLDDLSEVEFDWIVTVCDRAADNCPAPKGVTRILVAPFDDPPAMIAPAGDLLEPYRRVRDKIGLFVENLIDRLS